jgi:hypothetical protein
MALILEVHNDGGARPKIRSDSCGGVIQNNLNRVALLLLLAAFLLLGACADTSTGKEDGPHFFGAAGGANGAVGATSGMSLSW